MNSDLRIRMVIYNMVCTLHYDVVQLFLYFILDAKQHIFNQGYYTAKL